MKKIYLMKSSLLAMEMEVMKVEDILSEEAESFFSAFQENKDIYYELELNENNELIRIEFTSAGRIEESEMLGIDIDVIPDKCERKTMYINKKDQWEKKVKEVYDEKGKEGVEELFSKGWIMKGIPTIWRSIAICYKKNKEGEEIIEMTDESYLRNKTLRKAIRNAFKNFGQE